MGAGRIGPRDLDRVVAECDRNGGFDTPETTAYLADFEYVPETTVDPGLDPFSENYFERQVCLYRELTGRELNQSEGEQTPIDVDTHAAAANPYNRRDIAYVSRHARTVLTALAVANLPPGATVLDVGCGWGLSSEVIAYCGADVTAVDINPRFVELVRRRAGRFGLPIDAVHAEFDTFETDRRYDLLFFYECLHHALKPWETITRLARFVKPDGRIVFAGEPVNSVWWPHWGLRLDAQSVYCARKYGWWESGWSAEFISCCFEKSGFRLELFPEIGLDNGPIGFAVRTDCGGATRANETILEPFRRHERERRMFETDLSGRMEALRQRIASMEASRWWRLTAPLRSLTRRIARKP
jgi:SAM-dependent methyltransferase